MNKKKILFSAIITIMLCLSVITGATFAIFTSESQINVAVNSGSVEIVATASDFSTSSAKWDETANDYIDEMNSGLVFATLGEVFVNDKANDVTVVNMAPGDAVYFKINVENKSNIKIKYQVEVFAIESSDFFGMLEISIGNDVFTGFGIAYPWETWETQGVRTIDVSVKLPITAGNEAANKSAKFAYRVNAVQANAHVVDPETNAYYIYNAGDLINFANAVNGTVSNTAGNSFAGKKIVLRADIDLAGYDWTPIGQTGFTQFAGEFDGNGYAIKNLNVNSLDETYGHYSSGFFGWVETHGAPVEIKNVTFVDPVVKGNHNVGVVVGAAYGVIFENVHVVGAEVYSEHNAIECGDKVGGIVGYSFSTNKIANCSVKNSTVAGCRDLGGIAGLAYADTLLNNEVTNVTVTADFKSDPTDSVNANEIVGRVMGGGVLADTNVANSVTVNK